MSRAVIFGDGRPPAPTDVIGYLDSKGWRRMHLVNGRSSVWVDAGSKHEVFVPLRAEGPDYPSLLAEAITTIARNEDRLAGSVAEDMRVASADVVRIRRIGSEGDLLPLDLGARFFSSAANVMVAAACAAYEPRASYGPRKASEITEFSRQAGFDRTERGSFIVKIVCPLAPRIQAIQATLDGMESSVTPPFARKTTEALVRALEAARSAAANAIADRTLDGFVDSVDQGVSANLCSALGDMGSDSSLHEVEVSVTWARTWPRPPGGNQISMSREFLGIMSQGASRLADVAEREDYEIMGPVVAAASDAGPGEVRVSAVIDGRPRRVRVELGADLYNKAVLAHVGRETGVVLRCVGSLSKDGRMYRLRNPRKVQVLESDDPDED